LVPLSSGGEFIPAESSINLNQIPLLYDVETQKPLITWAAYIAFNRYIKALLHIGW
jgi:hypothetical protein